MEKTIVIILFFYFSSLLLSSPKESKSNIQVTSNNKKIDVYFGGKIRLQGGHFILQSKEFPINNLVEKNGKYLFSTSSKPVEADIKKAKDVPVIAFFLSPNGNQSDSGKFFLGFFFDQIPGMLKGVTLWRYGPWNSWTKSERIDSLSQIKNWDVQFFYWQYSDGLYGAAMPLSGKGYRTTLGQEKGAFGSKSISYFDNMKKEQIPQMAVGFGNDPYELFQYLFHEGLKAIGKENDLISQKKFPGVFKGIGWCSWNASDMGNNLNEKLLLNTADSFSKANFPIKWLLIDDGWFDNTDSKLNSFYPDKGKFPDGFKPVINKLKKEYGISDLGIWHAFNGYWQGINPESELGKVYKKDLFTWKEKVRPDIDSSDLRTCYFISPYSKLLNKFYNGFHSYLKKEGFSFIKVDNQLITERMAVNNFPVFEGSEKYHQALNSSAAKYFNNAIINCMDMTAEAYLNFGNTSIARAEDDYYPGYEEGHPLNFWMSRAAGHVLQAVYNSLYFSQMVYPDFDMFESTNPSAQFHAIARAINNGPIYITDKVDQHDFNVLFSLIYNDGKILRPDKSLIPTEDCLFQVWEPKPLKAFSMDGNTGLLGLWNCSDSNEVNGSFKPSDVHKIRGEEFAVYEFFNKDLKFASRDQEIPVNLNQYGYKLYYIIPLINGNGVIGLVNKYNAPASVLKSKITGKEIQVDLYEGGKFAAALQKKPVSVKVNGKEVPFNFTNGLLNVNIPIEKTKRHVKVDIAL